MSSSRIQRNGGHKSNLATYKGQNKNKITFDKQFKSIIESRNLSVKEVAEKIGVQRSSISHLLSGRNKPSLDFILKVLKTFDEVELYWLLNGKGTFPKQVEKATKKQAYAPTLFSEIDKVEEESVVKSEDAPVYGNSDSLSKVATASKEIERIVIFYKDGTFDAYRNK